MSTLLTGLLVALFVVRSIHGGPRSFFNCPTARKERCLSQFVKFYLFTRQCEEYVEFRDDGVNNLTSSHYQADKRSIVIIHGYTDSMRNYILQAMKTEYLKKEDINIWLLDWSSLTPDNCYVTSVYNLNYVGKCLASFVDTLGRPESGLHVIGFSLGGHVAALAANVLKPYLIPRVTGLDPAMPLFVFFPSQKRLSPDHGKFVDVIHTNAFLQGNFLLMGHVDFFMNGGIDQPGCGSIFHFSQCSHERAPWYFIESIYSDKGFWGRRCTHYIDAIRDTCSTTSPLQLMGEHVDFLLRGVYYIETNSKSPFAKGKVQISKRSYYVYATDDNEYFKEMAENTSLLEFKN